MVQLSNVVGSLLRGLLQSHTIADAYTVKTLETYRRHDVLSQLPVPRMAIREAQLTLRFAVADVPGKPDAKPDAGDLLDLWHTTMREHIVPESLREIGRLDNKTVVAAFAKRLETQHAEEFIDPAALLDEGAEGRLVEATLKYLSVLLDSLAPSTRRMLGDADLSAVFERVVEEQVPDLRAAAKKLQEAAEGALGELDIVVTAEGLRSIPESQISQLTLSLGMEDIRFGTLPDDLTETQD